MPLRTGTSPALLPPGDALDGGLCAAPPPLAAPAAAAREAEGVRAHALARGTPREPLQQRPLSSSGRPLSAATRRRARSCPARRAQVAGRCYDLSGPSLRRGGGGGGPEVRVRMGVESNHGPLSDSWEGPDSARRGRPPRGGGGSDPPLPHQGEGETKGCENCSVQCLRVPPGHRLLMENFAAGVRSISNSPAQVIP